MSTIFERSVLVFLMCLVVVIVAILLLRPIYDPDFYWHLKTGQWIWQNGTLPYLDPFGVTPLPETSPRIEFMLTSDWLSQLILYAFYSIGGMSGIILFRWIIACFSLLLLRNWANMSNSNVVAVIGIGTTLLLEYYFIERPQFVSFICFGVVLVLLFRFLDHKAVGSLWRTLVPLSLLMLVWSNMHGGYLIGQAILIYCVIAEGIKFFHNSLSPLSSREYRILFIASISALLASFINPNCINLIKYLPVIFDPDHYSNRNILEQLSLIGYFKETNDSIIFIYIASMAVTVGVLLVSEQRKNITVVGILAGTAFMGSLHMRLIPFFLISAMIFMTKYIETEYSVKKGKFILIPMFIATIIFCFRDELRILKTEKSGWVPVHQFPTKAADFITINKISGNIYTTADWGGYIIWRMNPENKIFHDGRMLYPQRAWESNNARIIADNQPPYWKGLFNMYNIQIVVLPIYENNWEPCLLTKSIFTDIEWATVFADEKEVVFVRMGKVPQLKQYQQQ